MHEPVAAPPRPALALPPRPARRRGLWAGPLLLSLAFVAAVLLWLRKTEADEVDDQRAALISDALSLEAQVSGRIERESELLERLAARLPALPPDASSFAGLPDVQQGLHRFWVSITWLDASNRIVAHLPEQAPDPEATQAANRPGSGVSSHLSAAIPGGGTLVARYSSGDMLRQTVPWWLARKYDVRVVDSFGDVMASTTEALPRPGHQTHRTSLEPQLPDSYLELIARDRVTPWYRSFPMTMVAGFVALIAAMTWLLRRQVIDVSRAEKAWRTEAAWRSAMEDSLTVGLRARDLDGRILYVNRALADIVGYAPEALVGLVPPMPYWPPDAIEEIMVRHRRAMAGDAPREGYETRWLHRDGRLLDVLVFEAPLVDARGRRVGSMGSIVDITEAKRHEERERRQIESMTHHARLTMLGEVAATLAHELNQPLTAIASYNAGVLNSLQRQPAGAAIDESATDPMVLRALERVGEQAAHAGRIVQRIRQFLTRHEPQFEACSINDVIEGGVALLRRELERQRVLLEMQLDPTLPPVEADAVLVEQVVINLVRNAGDALAERGAEPRRIDVRSLRSADRRFVRIDVQDNGPGLQGRSVEALCAPFYSTKRDGMGMGLAICRSIVQAHHGAFDAAESPGGGACFSLTLPVAR
ncbi:MAG: PAS domain S-box protein [Proteobacteria bacterium]|nr:PAS domain S-box protein [Pseudomonadota bacterium]